MIEDVVERFRYRFQLWRREQREDYLSPLPHNDELGERDYIAIFSKHPELVTESTLASTGRCVGFFGVISIAAYICFWIIRFFPASGFPVGLVFVVFVCLWTLCGISFEIQLQRARKQYRQREAKESSN